MTTNSISFLSQGIGRRLILALVLFSSLITLIATAYQLFRDYEHDLSLIDSRLQEVQEVHLKSIAGSLWVADAREMQILVEGILNLSDMQYLEIKDGDKVWASSGLKKSENIVIRNYRLTYSHLGREQKIGTLTVVATLEGVYRRLIDKALVILISNAIKTFLVSGFMLFIFHFLVTRHLKTISDYLREQHGAVNFPNLHLNRQKHEEIRTDELDLVVDEVNDLQERLADSFVTLTTSEELFRGVAENAIDLVWVGSADWSKIFYVNPAYERIWGRSQQSLIDQPRSWLDGLDPRDLPAVVKLIETTVDGLASDDDTLIDVIDFPEYRVTRPDGKTSWVLAHAVPVRDDTGKILRIVGIGTDITRVKQAEQALWESKAQLGDIALNLPGVVYQFKIDAKGTPSFPYVSPKIREVFGVDAAAVSNDAERWMELIHPDDRTGFDESIQKSYRNLGTWIWEGRMISPSGETRWVRASSTPRTTEDGSVLWNGLILDITEVKTAENQLIQTAKLASLGEMATGVAHELNQPLNVIRMAADSLVEMSNDGKAPPPDILTKRLERISSQTERAATIIDRMRTFGRSPMEQVIKISARDAVLGAISFLRESLRISGVELQLGIPETCRPVMGDQIQLEQVVLNLLTNARDAIEDNARTTAKGESPDHVSVRVEDDSETNVIKVIVKDTGGGIPQDVLPKIFDPFFTTKEIGKGTGVGLSVSYGIVTEMGGTIMAENADGGAMFTVTLPAVDGEPE